MYVSKQKPLLPPKRLISVLLWMKTTPLKLRVHTLALTLTRTTKWEVLAQPMKNRLSKRDSKKVKYVEDDRCSSSNHEKSDTAEDLFNNSSSESESSSMEEVTVKTRIRRQPKITNHSSAMNFHTENGRTARKFLMITDEQDEPCFTKDSQHHPDYSYNHGNREGSIVHADESQVESDKLTGKVICKSNNLFAENLVIRFSL